MKKYLITMLVLVGCMQQPPKYAAYQGQEGHGGDILGAEIAGWLAPVSDEPQLQGLRIHSLTPYEWAKWDVKTDSLGQYKFVQKGGQNLLLISRAALIPIVFGDSPLEENKFAVSPWQSAYSLYEYLQLPMDKVSVSRPCVINYLGEDLPEIATGMVRRFGNKLALRNMTSMRFVVTGGPLIDQTTGFRVDMLVSNKDGTIHIDSSRVSEEMAISTSFLRLLKHEDANLNYPQVDDRAYQQTSRVDFCELLKPR